MKRLGHRDSLRVGLRENGERLLLTVDQVADMLGVSRTSAYVLVSSGQIPSIKLNSMIRVPAAALLQMIEDKMRQAQND